MVIIPTDTTGKPYYSQTLTLDAVSYLFEFRFNFRENCWYLQISTVDGTTLAQGIKLVNNFFLLQRFSDDNLPPGELFSYTGPGIDDSPAGLNDFGKRCILYYISRSEVPAGVDTHRL